MQFAVVNALINFVQTDVENNCNLLGRNHFDIRGAEFAPNGLARGLTNDGSLPGFDGNYFRSFSDYHIA
jgi:hypothetical protein